MRQSSNAEVGCVGLKTHVYQVTEKSQHTSYFGLQPTDELENDRRKKMYMLFLVAVSKLFLVQVCELSVLFLVVVSELSFHAIPSYMNYKQRGETT